MSFSKIICFSIIFLFAALGLAAQVDWSGEWQGKAWQTGQKDTFVYSINWTQVGQALSGQSISKHAGSGQEGAFVVSGRVTDSGVQFQEVEQLRPEQRWCLKFATLRWVAEGDTGYLIGEWTADGCKPGWLALRPTLQKTGSVQPFSYAGRWTGHLLQSDRSYGFYYEWILQPDGTGTSRIISEGAGGEALHRLRWQPAGDGSIYFEEDGVQERTDPDWKWCLKRGTLKLQHDEVNDQLTGDWQGYLEHKSPELGACAPGGVVLNKPVVREFSAPVRTEQVQYSQEQQRSVKVDRTLRVQGTRVYIKIWDNGIVDGDVLTLFLNGQRIVYQQRVSKRKWGIPVDLIPGENLLILHAEDLGDISPNTVAVSLDDGQQEQVVILSSNLEESGAILIQPFIWEGNK